MRRSEIFASALIIFSALLATGQVVSPGEIKDAELRSLQLQYINDLQQIGKGVLASKFDYPFYLSRKLDLDELQQKHADQHSIRFDRYNGQVVIAITGNYYAAYSGDKTSPEQRARITFMNVVMPLLQAAVPPFQNNSVVRGYAVEVSHHILGKVMEVGMERPENLMVYLPQASAVGLLGSKDDSFRQSALLQGQVLLNAAPVTIWLNGEGPQLAPTTQADGVRGDKSGSRRSELAGVQGQSISEQKDSPLPLSPTALPQRQDPQPQRDTSQDALNSLQIANIEVLGRLVKELDPQAHFVSYATPTFVAFRQGIYLELSLKTDIPGDEIGSRYRLAALAFDDHVAHLIRPALAFFHDDSQFDGLSFSTTVHVADGSSARRQSEAVEFFFPFSFLRCYERYDCTGQQLIDAGAVLVNGERVKLDLEFAESGSNTNQ